MGYASGVTIRGDVARLLALYPRIYFACHQRHRRDPKTRLDISAHQASILDHLDPIEPTLVGALSGHMGVTPATMSVSLDRLERKKYVMRVRDPGDKRRVNILLTDAGARMKSAGSVLEPDRIRALLRHLSPTERTAAICGIELLAGAANEMMKRYGSSRKADAS